jgi:hypothetical protein
MRKLDRLGWVVEGTYRLGDATVGVRTTSDRFGAWIDEVLAHRRRARWRDADYSIVVGEADLPGRRDYHVLYRGIAPILRTRDLGTLARAFLEDAESHAFAGRRDAVYLEASLLAGPGGIALIPAAFTPGLGGLNRRAERLGVTLPGTTWVALDPASGRAVPVRTALGVPEDAVTRLIAPLAPRPDRFFVDEPTRVGTVCLVHDDPQAAVLDISRSTVLYRLAAVSRNLTRLGARGTLEALGSLAAGASCLAIPAMRAGPALETVAGFVGRLDPVRPLT